MHRKQRHCDAQEVPDSCSVRKIGAPIFQQNKTDNRHCLHKQVSNHSSFTSISAPHTRRRIPTLTETTSESGGQNGFPPHIKSNTVGAESDAKRIHIPHRTARPLCRIASHRIAARRKRTRALLSRRIRDNAHHLSLLSRYGPDANNNNNNNNDETRSMHLGQLRLCQPHGLLTSVIPRLRARRAAR